MFGRIDLNSKARLANRRETRNNSVNYTHRRIDMIVVMGEVRMGDGEIDRLQADLAAQMAATHAEDGCLQYVFSRDVTDPNLMLVSERWRDEAALAAHGKTPHMATFNAVIGTAKIVSINIKRYDVSGVTQLLGSD
jgi:quinol monooxygenase YgiN